MCVPGCMETVRMSAQRAAVPEIGVGSRSGLRSGVGQVRADAETGRAAHPSITGGPFGRVLDLTHTLAPAFPVFPGDPAIELTPYTTLDADGYNMNAWHLVEHTGTHLDAPLHFSDGGASVDAIEVSSLVVPLAVVDIVARARENVDYQLSCDDLSEWEARYGRLPQGACVAMHSGWGRLAIDDPVRFVGRDGDGTLHFPGIAPEAARWLLQERQIVGLAVDTLSLDHGPSHDYPTHRLWLPSGRWGLENVANLDQAPSVGAVLVVGVPKVKGATGAPVRLLTLMPA